MATTITMPQLGETVTEGTVAQWLKKVGDSVEKYESFVEVSTDKVNAEVPAPVSGIIRELIVKEGETVPTGAPIAIIDEVGAATAAPERAPAPHGAQPAAPPAAQASQPALDAREVSLRREADRQGADEPVPGHSFGVPAGTFLNGGGSGGNGSSSGNGASNGNAAAGSNGSGNGHINAPDVLRRVSPAVRRLAREHHVDLASVRGTGTGGRVTANDVLAAAGREGPASVAAATIMLEPLAPPVPARPAATGGKPSYANAAPGDLIPLTQARKIIAQRMLESKQTAPHAWTMVEVDVTKLWAWRSAEKEKFQREKGYALTLLPFFIHAVVQSLRAFPLMNARFTEQGIAVSKEYNIGIAVATEGNLIVPVIRHADELSIGGIAVAAGKIIEKARAGKLGADDLSGGTFTVNNTGANGSIMSAPIINGGQAGIVTMEAVVKRPIVTADDAIAVRSMMNVCLSLDHRVVDGAIASGFLVDLKKRLEAMARGGVL
jgi:2-oxoisovalerate dehydrogenase E2 component (dihydrolipoyl transacylase)